MLSRRWGAFLVVRGSTLSRTFRRPPVVKRQTPRGADCPIFSARVQAERHWPLAPWAVFMAVGGGPNVATPHTA
jgi:hypothetical protein